MSKQERREYFGLERVDFKFSKNFPGGFIVFNRFSPARRIKGRYPYQEIFQRGLFDGASDILASQYVIVINDDEARLYSHIKQLNITFKLLLPTSTGIYITFGEGQKDVSFHSHQVIHGPYDYLKLGKKDLDILKTTLSLIEKNGRDDKFKLCSELYSRALLAEKRELDVRYLLLIQALEALYLPERTTELAFRLRLYAAKLLGRNGREVESIYDLIKKIYEVRSEIIHRGYSKRLDESIFTELTGLVRKSLNTYVKEKKVFAQLEKLCLK